MAIIKNILDQIRTMYCEDFAKEKIFLKVKTKYILLIKGQFQRLIFILINNNLASHWFPYVKKRILIQYETSVDLNPLETACDELKQKCDDFEQCLKRKDLTLLELHLQGAIIPQVHCGPLAYAEAFLEPTDSNMKYSKQQKLKFKLIFKRLIELYQKGIDLYALLQIQLNQESTATNQLNKSASNSNETTLHRILQEKFNEFENTFRNLILIDGVSSRKTNLL
jgi:hypothetical protein